MFGLGWKGAGSRNNWRSWTGIVIALALLAGFCLWVYLSVRSEVVPIPSDAVASCKNAPDAADNNPSKLGTFRADNTKGADDGHVCLLRPDATH